MTNVKDYENVMIFDHPLIQHKISLMRDKHTTTKEFRELVSEVAMLMGYEVTRDLPLCEVEVETPVAMAKTKVLAGKKLALVPILRAGLGMVDGMLSLVPMAKVGHIGLFRDPASLKPVEYYCKLPEDIADRDVVLLDPMLATGGSAAAAVDFLKQRGIRSIKFMCLIAAPQGVEHLHNQHPEIPIYCAALDEKLNDHAYIVPGLGDAGDRLFGTK
ncbi:MAG: uracil phosphoribosyltransferase [Oscillospiraceae bacterium]|nr:uracil phosphoribosyltransferase [Oscillospiraceae bacterium]MDD4367915.1 uracil phosphoribosyltransferase [Oscillospiraceae bacterium]